MTDTFYGGIVKSFVEGHGVDRVLSIDLETIIRNQSDFLTDERIIAVSMSYLDKGTMKTDLLLARDDSKQEEDRLLEQLNSFVQLFRPTLIIGYNQTGYDLPLLWLKMRKRPYSKQLWDLKYYLSVSYCLDMMPVISDFLGSLDGDYKYRKLSEVVKNDSFAHLPLERKKELVLKDGKNIGEVIEELWRSGSQDFVEYCRGDTRDVLSIFVDIFKIKT